MTRLISSIIKSCIILHLLLTHHVLFAQTIVKLSGSKVNVKKPAFYIAEIIDARSNKDIIGIVQRGVSNKKETAQLENDMQLTMNTVLGDLTVPKSGATPVAMRILKLNVFERTLISTETGIAEVIVEFYEIKNNGYAIIKDAASTTISKGIDVTRSHARNIERCLDDCLDQLNKSLVAYVNTTSSVSSYARLVSVPDILDHYQFPILRTNEIAKGVYRNFVEFRNNKPGGTEVLSAPDKMTTSGSSTEIRQGKLYSKDGEETEAWGYFDGQNFFIKVGQEFFELLVDGDIFWFNGYDISNLEAKMKVPGKSILMGAFTGFFFYDVQVTGRVKPVRYAINLGNGDLVPLD